MARLFSSASNEYLHRVGAVVSGPPFTMVCWYKPTTNPEPYVMGMGTEAGGGAAYHLLEHNSSGYLSARSYDGSVGVATTSAQISTGAWNHLAGVFSATNARAALLNGANKGTNATDIDPTVQNTTIGCEIRNGSVSWPVNGAIAEVAFWNVALTDAEIGILADGFSPLFVRPESLVAYWPLVRDEDQDIVGGYNMTAYNTPSVGDHVPRIIYPTSSRVFAPMSPSGVIVTTVTVPVVVTVTV